MSGGAKKKSDTSDTGMPPQEEHEYTRLTRGMGSKTGAWNPDPDEQTTAILRDDVELSSNEIKFIMDVKAGCTRMKRGGRTVWGETESGKPLTLARIADRRGWDSGNASRYSERPLAYGFVR